MAVLLSLHSPLPVHCALDNIQAVRRANQIIEGTVARSHGPWCGMGTCGRGLKGSCMLVVTRQP
eukprot:12038719-Alexandrium_andersonii.AAC.1